MARQKGIAVISGVEMFVQQGARQFEIWTGKPAPEEEMLRVVLHTLRQGVEAAPELEPAPTQPETKAAAPVSAPAPAKPASEPAKKPAPKPVAAKPAAPARKPAKTAERTKSAPIKKVALLRKPRVASSKLKPARKASKPVRAKVAARVGGKTKTRSR